MRTIHIRCGDDLREKLPAAGFEGDYLSFVDPVCEGPTPFHTDELAFRRLRARYISDAYGGFEAEALSRLNAEAEGLERSLDYDRIVLWFEHDLFDQAVLIRLLDWYAARQDAHARLFLLLVNSHPGVERFIGLGQLTPEQLATLSGRERPVTTPQFSVASAAWAAFRSPAPTALWQLAEAGTPDLPTLAPALIRHLEEFPWTTDGLGLTQRLALDAVAAGADTPGRAFSAAQAIDPTPYLGDAMFHHVLRTLTTGRHPALTIRGDRVSLTDAGAAIRAGEEDWVRLNGVDQWRGGVHLIGSEAAWRWDPELTRIVPR